jgi:TatD DNase family protein
MIPFIDIHTHFRTNVLNVISVLNFTQKDDWSGFDTAFLDKKMYASVGLHPWFLTKENAASGLEKISELIDNQYIIALGECGLDRLKGESLELQTRIFEEQIRLAEKKSKPIIIHCVKAFSEIIAIKKRLSPSVPLIIHGFNQNEIILKELIKHGFFISIGTNVLKNNSNAYKAVTEIPVNQLFFETDDSNMDIKMVYEQAALLLNLPIEELKAVVFNNFNNILTV